MPRVPTGAAAPPLVTPELLGDVATAVGLREGVTGVRTILRELARRQPVSVRDLGRAVGLPLPIVSAVCGELRTRGVVAEERPLRLTIEAGHELGHGSVDAGRCPTCAGRGRIVPEDLWPLVTAQAAVEAASPTARVELDQAHCTPATAVRRALLLADEGALDGASVLLLGDDDLLSVAIAAAVDALGLPGPSRLVALDVDDALVEFLGGRLDSTAFEVRHHDLRDPLPDDFVGRFDVAVTDPPYTLAGARLFCSRAAEGLRDEVGADLFLSFGSTRADVVAETQRDLLGMGFALRSLVQGFNEYLGAGILGGTSVMYHWRSTGPLTALVAGRHDGAMYTSEGRDRPRRYVCRSCGREHLVGPTAPMATIALLQAQGCDCGGGVFDPKERV